MVSTLALRDNKESSFIKARQAVGSSMEDIGRGLPAAIPGQHLTQDVLVVVLCYQVASCSRPFLQGWEPVCLAAAGPLTATKTLHVPVAIALRLPFLPFQRNVPAATQWALDSFEMHSTPLKNNSTRLMHSAQAQGICLWSYKHSYGDVFEGLERP